MSKLANDLGAMRQEIGQVYTEHTEEKVAKVKDEMVADRSEHRSGTESLFSSLASVARVTVADSNAIIGTLYNNDRMVIRDAANFIVSKKPNLPIDQSEPVANVQHHPKVVEIDSCFTESEKVEICRTLNLIPRQRDNEIDSILMSDSSNEVYKLKDRMAREFFVIVLELWYQFTEEEKALMRKFHAAASWESQVWVSLLILSYQLQEQQNTIKVSLQKESKMLLHHTFPTCTFLLWLCLVAIEMSSGLTLRLNTQKQIAIIYVQSAHVDALYPVCAAISVTNRRVKDGTLFVVNDQNPLKSFSENEVFLCQRNSNNTCRPP